MKSNEIYLKHILDAVTHIQSFLSGITREDFQRLTPADVPQVNIGTHEERRVDA